MNRRKKKLWCERIESPRWKKKILCDTFISRAFNYYSWTHSIRWKMAKKKRGKQKIGNERKNETLSEYWFIESCVDTDKYHLIFDAFEVKLIFKTTERWLFLLSCSLLTGGYYTIRRDIERKKEKKEIERDSIMIKKKTRGEQCGLLLNGNKW